VILTGGAVLDQPGDDVRELVHRRAGGYRDVADVQGRVPALDASVASARQAATFAQVSR
jgi:hypothetical protein